jgi:hypothetical protein
MSFEIFQNNINAIINIIFYYKFKKKLMDKIQENWIFNKEFNFFWKNYSSVFKSSENKSLENYIKLTNASINATHAAKRQAFEAFNHGDSHKKKQEDESKIEFEISDDLVKFYEESLKFQKQKSSFLKAISSFFNYQFNNYIIPIFKEEQENQNKANRLDHYSHGEQGIVYH